MGNSITKDEQLARTVISIAGEPTDILSHCSLISKGTSIDVFQDTRDSEAFYLRNQVDRLLSTLSNDEITALVSMEKRLPASIQPLLYCVGNENNSGSSQVSFLTRVSPITLETELDRLRENGMTFNETDVWAILGVLLLTGSLLEQSMNYHKAICLKNVFVSESHHKIHLLNPFVLDAYLEGLLEQLVGPILKSQNWREEYWSDLAKREEAANYYPEIKQAVQICQANCNQMAISIALLGLQLASGLDENYFLTESTGTLDKMRINQAIDSIRTRYSSALRTFFRSIFSSVQRAELLSPSKILSSQTNQIKKLINSSISESAYTNEIFIDATNHHSNAGGPVIVDQSRIHNSNLGQSGHNIAQQSSKRVILIENHQQAAPGSAFDGGASGNNISRSRVVDRLAGPQTNSRERLNAERDQTHVVATGLPPLPPQNSGGDAMGAPGSYACLKQERSLSKTNRVPRNRRASPNRLSSGVSSSRRVSPNHVAGHTTGSAVVTKNSQQIPAAMRNYGGIQSFRPSNGIVHGASVMAPEQTVIKRSYRPTVQTYVTGGSTYIAGHQAFIHKGTQSPVTTLGPRVQVGEAQARVLTLRPSNTHTLAANLPKNSVALSDLPTRTVLRQAELGDRTMPATKTYEADNSPY